MTRLDSIYLALIAILLLLDYFVLWPMFLRRSQTDPGRARFWIWSAWMGMLWTLVAAGVVVWLIEGRAWGALRLISPHGWRLWGAMGLVLALAVTQGRTVLRIARSKRSKRIKLGNPHVERIAPHTRSELGWWMALSLTAGVCEELIFRGYLIWAFQPMVGLWGAAAVSVAVFAVAHAYQGVSGIFATGIVGGLLTLVVLMSGSLFPAMALHAIIDIGQGLVAWLVLRQVQGEDDLHASGSA
ncbi:MAG TPA: CPBP family intramembrane glutamic endopeptidase [Thermoanaerobaculia bacterium]|nr:CPBP family intramembrane glutamic endopeptidase [Thermoanaerobaculia bacterium]